MKSTPSQNILATPVCHACRHGRDYPRAAALFNGRRFSLQVIPSCFTYDRLNYAGYLPFDNAQMSNLSIDHHPGVYMIISQVEEEFGRIPVNQTIEETINKDTQTPGGTKGCSLKSGAVHKS